MCVQVFATPCDYLHVSKQDILLHCGFFLHVTAVLSRPLRCLDYWRDGICVKLKVRGTDENKCNNWVNLQEVIVKYYVQYNT